MAHIDHSTILKTLMKHETLTISDLVKEENLGISATPEAVQPILNELAEQGLVFALSNVSPTTYTITDKGILEGRKQTEKLNMQ